MTKFVAMIFVILNTHKAGAKHDILINTLASEANLLNKSSCLAPVVGVTKFIIVTAMILVTLLSILSTT